MHRKMIDVVASVINVLNSFNAMEWHDITEVQAKTGIPMDDITNAMAITALVDRFSPRMNIDPVNGTFTIVDDSKHVGKLPPSKDGGFPRLVAGKPGIYQTQPVEMLATMDRS